MLHIVLCPIGESTQAAWSVGTHTRCRCTGAVVKESLPLLVNRSDYFDASEANARWMRTGVGNFIGI